MRQNGSNGKRLNNLDSDVAKLKNEMEQSKQKFREHLETHIKEDLTEERFIGSGKPKYTYQEIADKHGVSKSQVQTIAEENNLTRRNKNIG